MDHPKCQPALCIPGPFKRTWNFCEFKFVNFVAKNVICFEKRTEIPKHTLFWMSGRAALTKTLGNLRLHCFFLFSVFPALLLVCFLCICAFCFQAVSISTCCKLHAHGMTDLDLENKNTMKVKRLSPKMLQILCRKHTKVWFLHFKTMLQIPFKYRAKLRDQQPTPTTTTTRTRRTAFQGSRRIWLKGKWDFTHPRLVLQMKVPT